MDFTQNLLENWILGGNLVVNKTLRKLRKPTTSRDNDICHNCYLLLVEQGKGCTIQSMSADQRGQRQSKIRTIKKLRGKGVGKRVENCKIAQFSSAKPFGPEKCPVYLRAPWIGSASQQLEHQVKSVVQTCYGAVSPRLIFSSQCMLPAAKKDVLPANQRSMVIYEYV